MIHAPGYNRRHGVTTPRPLDSQLIEEIAMPRPIVDRTGRRYGKLTVTGRAGSTLTKRATWFCRCDCGNEIVADGGNLNSGHIRSCGCLQAETQTTHGESGGGTKRRKKSVEYRAWSAIIRRCHNPADTSFPNYGERGIVVCDRWRNSFEAFLTDMGRRPKGKTSIDRIDNDGPYSPDNCRWATSKQQTRNYRQNVFLTVNGETRCVMEWAERTSIHPQTLYKRLARGWDHERTVLTPTITKYAPRR